MVLREQGKPEQGMGNNKQGNVLTLVVTAIQCHRVDMIGWFEAKNEIDDSY